MARPSPVPVQRPSRRGELLLLGGALLVALAVRVGLALGNSGLTMDSPLYVRMAEDVLAGRLGPSPAHHGYPLLVALAALVVPGRELPGRVVSCVASLALVAEVWAVARRRSPPRNALVPALIVALHPLLAVYGTATMTEATFLALAFGGVALLDAARPFSGGVLLGAAWWVRPEAAVVAPLAVLFAPLTARRRMLALLAAALVALSYGALLRVEQGHWSLSPKTALVRAPYAGGRAAEWRLADSTAFADSVGLATRIARDGPAILRAYPARLDEHFRQGLAAWPLVLLGFSMVGLVRPAGRGPWLAFAALPLVYPLLSAPADLRFSQLVLPALVVPFGFGAGPLTRSPRAAFTLSAVAGLVALVLLWTGPTGRLALAFDDGPMPAMRGAGTWLAEHSGADAVIMDRKSFVPFFANRRHVQLPDEPLGTLLDYARASGATHLVVEEYVVRSLRPQLAPLLDARDLAHEPRVRLVFALRPAPGEGVAVLEVVR
ncbi:MAG TPA: hypothetical protein VI504_02305 [Candidatus Eisenbacteria bacterium]|jgi:hypothetical protein